MINRGAGTARPPRSRSGCNLGNSEIFCHFQKYKAQVCRTNGSKVTTDHHFWTLFLPALSLSIFYWNVNIIINEINVYTINLRAKNQDFWCSTRRHLHCHVYWDLTILPDPARGVGIKSHVPVPLDLTQYQWSSKGAFC